MNTPRMPKKSATHMIDNLRATQAEHHGEQLRNAFDHVKGDGFTAALDNPRRTMKRLERL